MLSSSTEDQPNYCDNDRLRRIARLASKTSTLQLSLVDRRRNECVYFRHEPIETQKHKKPNTQTDTYAQTHKQLEEAAQGKPSAKYRPMRVVVDAALRRIRQSRHGGHKFANISVNCQRI